MTTPVIMYSRLKYMSKEELELVAWFKEISK